MSNAAPLYGERYWIHKKCHLGVAFLWVADVEFIQLFVR